MTVRAFAHQAPANDNGVEAPSEAMIAAAVALAGGRRASVAVRLDAARHLRLRLACALGGQSAQAILCDALDAHLDTIDGLAALIAGMDAGGCEAATGQGTER